MILLKLGAMAFCRGDSCPWSCSSWIYPSQPTIWGKPVYYQILERCEYLKKVERSQNIWSLLSTCSSDWYAVAFTVIPSKRSTKETEGKEERSQRLPSPSLLPRKTYAAFLEAWPHRTHGLFFVWSEQTKTGVLQWLISECSYLQTKEISVKPLLRTGTKKQKLWILKIERILVTLFSILVQTRPNAFFCPGAQAPCFDSNLVQSLPFSFLIAFMAPRLSSPVAKQLHRHREIGAHITVIKAHASVRPRLPSVLACHRRGPWSK